MSPDMNARFPGTRVGIRIQVERFDLITRVLGCESDAGRARLLDVDPKTIYRARQGDAVGERFIANALYVAWLHREKLKALNLGSTFEDLFEVFAEADQPAQVA